MNRSAGHDRGFHRANSSALASTETEDSAIAAKFDVHLRETLRVVSDAVRLADSPLWARRTPMPSTALPRG